MRTARTITVLFFFGISCVVAPPPRREQVQQDSTPKPEELEKKPYEFTYSKYLEEVVRILEEDPAFNDKLRSMSEDDIKAGKIAEHVEELPDPIMQRLHTLKVAELERLRLQIQQQVEADGGHHNIKLPQHLDLQNWEKFNKDDLKNLIKATVEDMEAIDRERKDNFKEYEMKKQAELDHKFAQLTPEEREKAKHEEEEKKKRHAEHEKLKHPGSRDQLEEVWSESDQMAKDSFDPRTFFMLHDINGDGFWNADEMEALFQIELEKLYNETNPDDDPREKVEEMYRMREHVVKQMDKNGDRMISLEEFLQDEEAQAANNQAKQEEWKDLGQKIEEHEIFTDEELRKFEEDYAKQQGYNDHPGGGGGQQQQQQIHPAEVNRAGAADPNYHHPPPVVTHGDGVNPPAPPQYNQPGQQQQVHQQQVNQQQPVQPAAVNQPPPIQVGQPIHDIPKDPTYGI